MNISDDLRGIYESANGDLEVVENTFDVLVRSKIIIKCNIVAI